MAFPENIDVIVNMKNWDKWASVSYLECTDEPPKKLFMCRQNISHDSSVSTEIIQLMYE